MDIGTHFYGREDTGSRASADGENPVITAVVDELRTRGAVDRAGADRLLPEPERDLGELTGRERTAVLDRFEH